MSSLIRSIVVRLCRPEINYRGHVTSGGRLPERELLILELSNGVVSGFGEFYPTSLNPKTEFHGWSTLDELELLLQHCETMIGKDAQGLRGLIPQDWECYDGNGLVDVVEFALYDLVGKIFGLPAHTLLGGKRKEFLWGMPVVYTADVEEMVEQARERFVDYGYRYFKLKPSGNLEHDFEVISRIRETTDRDVVLYIDPNYGLSMEVPQVIDYLNALHSAGLSVCEDPIQCSVDAYREIQKRTSVTLMLDQSARTPRDVLEIVNARCCRQINIHANWTSGFNGALRLAHLAAVGGIECMIGSTIYLGIGNAACEILSGLLPGNCPCEQVTAGNYVRNPVVKREFPTIDGKIYLTDDPGLGVEVDLDKLEEATVRRFTIA